MLDEITKLKEEEKRKDWQASDWEPISTAELKQFKTQAGESENISANDSLGWGAFLIIIGVALLFGRFTGILFRNWWAWFILIPAGIKLYKGLQLIETGGRFNSTAASMISGSVFLVMLGLFFLFGLSWALFWPILLICLGLNGIMWAYVKK